LNIENVDVYRKLGYVAAAVEALYACVCACVRFYIGRHIKLYSPHSILTVIHKMKVPNCLWRFTHRTPFVIRNSNC